MGKQGVRTPVIAGNWKMHMTCAQSREFMEAFLPLIADTPDDRDLVLAAVMTATMTTGHDDDSEHLFPTDRFRKRMSSAAKNSVSADAPLHISQNTFAKTNAPESVALASSQCSFAQRGTPEAVPWHARDSVVARQRQCL